MNSAKPAPEETAKAQQTLDTAMSKAFGELAGLGMLKSPCQFTGRSGVRHGFTFGFGDTAAAKVVGDVVISGMPVDETKVLSLFIKIYDTGAKRGVLCAVPALTPEAKKLSSLYNILTVEAESSERLLALATESLQRLSKELGA